MRRDATRTLMLGALVTAGVLLAGCSSGAAGGGAATSMGTSQKLAPVAGPTGADAARNPSARPAGLTDQSLIKTGDIEMTTRHPAVVRQRLDHLLKAINGRIDDEQTERNTHGQVTSSHLVIRVPAATFEAAFEAIQRLGNVRHADSSSQDVTSDVIDTRERIQTLTNSLSRLMKFQRQATDVSDLLRYENAITKRRAELQSLRGRRHYLHSQTTMSTINLNLTRARHHVAPPPLGHAGFLTGLQHGWHGFTIAVVAVLTALGAALPFLLLAAVVGIPAWLLLRRRRQATGS